MKMRKVITAALLAMLIASFLTGCLSISVDELFSLPEVSEEYIKLQAQINMLLSRGAVFAAPSRGPNRQAVQLMDINSNGDNEVIAFFTYPGDSKLMIYVFTMDEGDYALAEIIESVGTEVESVRYVDMNGDGSMEIIIGWQMGSTLKYMSIYSIVDFTSQLLVNGEEYTEIAVLGAAGSSGESVIALKLPIQDTGNAAAKIYTMMQDGEVVPQEARLSAGIETISRVVTGSLTDNVPALFVESEGRFDNGSLVTDILTWQAGVFTNISLNPSVGISSDTIRHRMNSAEINNDGIIKVPALRRLIAQSETEYYAIDWYTYSSTGDRSLALTTYHNTFDEWYLILPGDWREKVSVRRDDSVPGERTILFSYFDNPDDDTYDDFLKIYRLTGDNAEERALEDGKNVLITEGSVTYAFELLTDPNSFGLTFNETMVRDNFRLIRTEWQPG